MLESSWAFSFYHNLFCRLDETIFADLYSKRVSRPNVPVNILFGFEVIKAGFGWSDEELYSHFLFDMQVRFALGLRDFDYEQTYGENLIQKAMEQVPDEQLKKFKVKTGFQQMDSTLIQSNIRRMSRIQLLVELIKRLYRNLGKEEKKANAQRFSPHVKQSSTQYCYRMKTEEAKEPSASDWVGFFSGFWMSLTITERQKSIKICIEPLTNILKLWIRRSRYVQMASLWAKIT